MASDSIDTDVSLFFAPCVGADFPYNISVVFLMFYIFHFDFGGWMDYKIRGEDSQIRMWDLRTRRCKVIFTGHSKAVTCLTKLKEDGSHLILSGAKVSLVFLLV